VIVGIDSNENELAILEFIHFFVETLDGYFNNVCELDIMFSIEKVHMILDEMVIDGVLMDMNRRNVMTPIMMIDNLTNK